MPVGAACPQAVVTVHIHGAFRSIGNNVVPQLVCAGKMPLVAVLLRRLTKVLDCKSEQFQAVDNLTGTRQYAIIATLCDGFHIGYGIRQLRDGSIRSDSGLGAGRCGGGKREIGRGAVYP